MKNIRLHEMRYWVIFNYLVFIIVALSFHYFRWTTMSIKGHLSIVVQTLMQFLLTIGLIISYFKSVKIIYYLTLLQSIQFLLFNFLHFTEMESENHVLLNLLSTIFTSLNIFISSCLFLSMTAQVIPCLVIAATVQVLFVVSVVVDLGFATESNTDGSSSLVTDILFVIAYFIIAMVMAVFVCCSLLGMSNEFQHDKQSLFDLLTQFRVCQDTLHEGSILF